MQNLAIGNLTDETLMALQSAQQIVTHYEIYKAYLRAYGIGMDGTRYLGPPMDASPFANCDIYQVRLCFPIERGLLATMERLRPLLELVYPTRCLELRSISFADGQVVVGELEMRRGELAMPGARAIYGIGRSLLGAMQQELEEFGRSVACRTLP